MNIFDVIPPEGLAFLAAFLGTLWRTLQPYYQKLREDPTLTFDIKYAITLILALITSLLIAIMSIPLIPLSNGLSPLLIFGNAFAWAYATNSLFNSGLSSAQSTTPEPLIGTLYGKWTSTLPFTANLNIPSGSTVWVRQVYVNGNFDHNEITTTTP